MSASNLSAPHLGEECNLSRNSSMRSVRRKKKKGIVRKRSDCKYPVMNYCNDCREWFLQNVPILKMIPEELLSKVVDIMIEKHYQQGEIIKAENERINNVFIIAKGYAKKSKLKVKQRSSMSSSENEEEDNEDFLGYLGRGDSFGDIISDESISIARFSVTAVGEEGVECLVLEKEAYQQLLKDAEVNISSDQREKRNQTMIKRLQKFNHLSLKDLIVLGTLGSGGFGRVNLVRMVSDVTETYALKQMKKTRIVEAKQQDHVMHERNILLQVDSDFIIRLYRTFKDRKYLYMMMEVCLGGELWSILREKRRFDNQTARFYSGCIVAALDYLHSRHIIYRDIKPENMLLDHRGYCKLTDFGFAKRIGPDRRTWTFCGTPDYVAPEIILYSGHDISCDYWSLGVLIYELLCGKPPFIAAMYTTTYELVIEGIDKVEFPEFISKEAQNIIKKLCRANPTERLGYGGIGVSKCFKHPWFGDFDCDELLAQKMSAPFIPEIKSSTDRRNFDSYKEERDGEPDDDVSGWDRDF